MRRKASFGTVVVGVMAVCALSVAPSFAAVATIREVTAAGPEANAQAGITATVAAFQADLSSPNNGNAVGTQPSGRRQITWDGADNDSAPARLQPDFFNAVAPRGVIFGGGDPRITFQQSADATPSVPGTPNEFGNVNPTYPTAFSAFSVPRLFSSLTSNVYDVDFFVAGSLTRAESRGFGAVFTDVDTAGSSKLEFFDRFGNEIFEREVLATAGNESLSFVGVTFTGPELARVRVTSGAAPLGAANDVTQGGAADLAVVDDFNYGEPQAQPVPALSFASAEFSGSEGGTASVVIDRSGDLQATAKVGVTLTDGSATAGSDYEPTGGTLTFGPGETQKSINVPLETDDLVEGAETVNLALESATSNGSVPPTIGPTSTATISIANVPDSKSPLLELSFAETQKLSRKNPSLELRAFCDEACSLEAGGSIALKGKKKPRRAKPVGLAGISAELLPTTFQTIDVPLSKKAARKVRGALRRGRRANATLSLGATDAAGNLTSQIAKVRLRLS